MLLTNQSLGLNYRGQHPVVPHRRLGTLGSLLDGTEELVLQGYLDHITDLRYCLTLLPRCPQVAHTSVH